jgi:hypothetical protein
MMRAKAFASACWIGAGVLAAAPAATAGPAITLTPPGKTVEERGSTVVLMRDGSHTVVSIQSRFRGSIDGVALLIPVKKGVSTKDVRALPREVFARLDALSAPRLVELWELDPCEPQFEPPPKETGVMPYEYGVDPAAVLVDGEYEMIAAAGSTPEAIKAWLTGRGYEVTPAVERAVERAMKNDLTFVLARVHPSKVTFEGQGTEREPVLSPIRFAYESATLELPPGVGDSSSGEDVVLVLSPDRRFGVVKDEAPPIPTNLDVRPAARDAFDAFYAGLLAKQREKVPGRFITEYAWPSDGCEPCATEPLDANDLLTLGADITTKDRSEQTKVPRIRPVTTTPVSRAAAPVLAGVLLPCYRAALEQTPNAAAVVSISLKPRGEFALGVSMGEGADKLGVAFKTCADKALVAPLRISIAEGNLKRLVEEARFAFELAPPPPPSRFVLTRLRAPSGAAPGPVELGPVPGLAGGRELRNAAGLLEGTSAAEENHFQARYVVRHPWTEPTPCAKPVRGRWGVERGRSLSIKSAHPVREAAATAKLGELLAQDVPELGIQSSGSPGDAPPPSAVGSAPSAARNDPASKGCSCMIAARDGGGTLPSAALALLIALRSLTSRPSRRRGRACSRSRTP